MQSQSVAEENLSEKSPLPASWMQVLGQEFQRPYMQELKGFLRSELEQGKVIFPPMPEIFSAFQHCDFDQVKVVIIGQDPYHGPGQAHGMCFSVRPGVRIPPSLVNIYKELQTDLGIEPAPHGFLQAWADQGVLLLNATLTVERSKAGSHQGKGWEEFTDRVVTSLATQREGLVFILWGAYAQKKAAGVDRKRHLVLESPHPSPFSAHRGFLGSRPFSKTNQYLTQNGQKPVDWSLPSLQ